MSAKQIVTRGQGWVNLVTTKFLTNVFKRVSRGLEGMGSRSYFLGINNSEQGHKDYALT